MVLVLSLLLVVQGLPNGRRPHSLRGKKALDKFIFKRALSKVATVSHVRQTRAVCKTDCDRASSALDLRNAQTCLTTLNKDFGESPDSSVTSTEAKTYCDNHCDTLLVGIFNNITACCGDSVSDFCLSAFYIHIYVFQGADNILPALQDSCKHNSNGDLCVQDDGLVAKLFTDPSQGMGQSLIVSYPVITYIYILLCIIRNVLVHIKVILQHVLLNALVM